MDIKTATGGVLKEKTFLEISQNLQENICARVLFFKRKLQASETLAQVFSCEYGTLSKNTSFMEYLLAIASVDRSLFIVDF